MFLKQEYLERHKIKLETCPVVYNSNKNNACVLLKNNLKNICNKYRLLTISPSNKEGDPGKFTVELFYPAYNSGKKNIFFIEDRSFNTVFYWKNYKDEIKKYLINLKFLGWNSIKSDTDLDIAFWEILLLSFDSMMVKFPVIFNEKIYGIFDETLTSDNKNEIIKKCISFMKKDCSFQTYSKEILNAFCFLKKNYDINDYSSWIFDLI